MSQPISYPNLVVFLLLFLGGNRWLQAQMASTADQQNTAEITEQIAETCDMLLTHHLVQCFPAVRLDKDAKLIAADMLHVIDTYGHLFSLKLRYSDSLSGELGSKIQALDDLYFPAGTDETDVYVAVKTALLDIEMHVKQALLPSQKTDDDVLGKLILKDIEKAGDEAETKSADKNVVLPYAIENPLTSVLPEDHSQLVFDYLRQEEGFTLQRSIPMDLLSSLNGVWGAEADRNVETRNIPETIAIRFTEGEFLLKPVAMEQLKEVSFLLATYADLQLYISPEFEAIESPLSMRRMRSVRVKLARLGLSQERIDAAMQAKDANSDQIHIIVANE